MKTGSSAATNEVAFVLTVCVYLQPVQCRDCALHLLSEGSV
jgi:hypothetical protein